MYVCIYDLALQSGRVKQKMKEVHLFTVLVLTVISNGAPTTDYHTEDNFKREYSDCYTEFVDCKEVYFQRACEKKYIHCALNDLSPKKFLMYCKRVCSMPPFEEGAKKGHSALRKNVVATCYEDFDKCRNEHPEEEEYVPLNIMTECLSDMYSCLLTEHIENYPDLLEEGRTFCKRFRKFEANIPKEPCEPMKEKCLKAAEGNVIGVAECDTAYQNCKLEEAD